MRTVAIIPARYASTRLEGKPLMDIGGKPMVQWVYERAKQTSLVDDVLVATDHREIMARVEGFGGKVAFTSPYHRSGTERVAEVAEGLDADIIVNLQGDEPLIEPAMIDEAIRPLLSDRRIAMGTLKTRIINQEELNNPNIVKVVTDKDGFALYFSRLPIPYVRDSEQWSVVSGQKPHAPCPMPHAPIFFKHIGLYVYQKGFLLELARMKPTPLEKTEGLEQLRVLENGYRIKVVETAHQSIGVDTMEDLERVREVVSNLATKQPSKTAT